jgi:hypothetical protein
MGSDADHPNSLGSRLSRACLISKICGAAWNYDHDPAWNDPTARRATFDNRQANLMRRSCWRDNLACITQTCHERLCGTKTSTFEHRTFSRKSWNAHRIFIPQGDVTCGVNISHLHGPRRATPQIHHRPRQAPPGVPANGPSHFYHQRFDLRANGGRRVSNGGSGPCHNRLARNPPREAKYDPCGRSWRMEQSLRANLGRKDVFA